MESPATQNSGGPRLPHKSLRASSFFWGIQFSLTGPLMALLLVDVYHATTSQVALTLFVSNLFGIAWGWLVPRQADKRLNYLWPVMLSAVAAVTMVGLLSLEHATHLALVTYMLLSAPAGVGFSMVFAYARHLGLPPSDIVSIRSYMSMAWIAGPPLATLLIASVGGRWLLLAIGLNAFINLSIAAYLIRRHMALQHLDLGPRHVPAGVNRRELAGLIIAFGLFQAAMIVAMTTTTLFATETLHLSAVWGGLALSIAAGLEVPVLLWLRTSADRGDEFATMKKAALVGVLYYLLMATAAGSVELLAVQVLNALFVAVVAGTGLTLFQRIVGMPGAAAGLQGNASRVGTTMTGPILALGANHWIGLRAVFLVAALCALVGGAAVALVHRSFRARAALIGVAS